MKNIFAINVLVTLALVLLFDMMMYNFLPNKFAYKLTEYRFETNSAKLSQEFFYQDYYEKHDSRGFDIRKKALGTHLVDGVEYPIWSNSLGCFDREHSKYDDYVYFAGDSFTWGFTPFEDKFGALIEKDSGTSILKCGVTHTGQRHQLEKFREIVETTDALPAAIFVFFFENDVINDYAHPHSTVIDGWQVNSVSINDKWEIDRRPGDQMRAMLTARLSTAEPETKSDLNSSIKLWLKRHSLSANLASLLLDATGGIVTPARASPKTRLAFYHPAELKNGHMWYADNPRTQANRAALKEFQRFSQETRVPLVVVLIPPKPDSEFDDQWYTEVRGFLKDNEIEYFDVTDALIASDISPSDLYWRYDAHLNPAGNKVIADALLTNFPQIFDDID